MGDNIFLNKLIVFESIEELIDIFADNSSVIPIDKLAGILVVTIMELASISLIPTDSNDVIFEFIFIEDDNVSDIPIVKEESEITDWILIEDESISDSPKYNTAGIELVTIIEAANNSVSPVVRYEEVFEIIEILEDSDSVSPKVNSAGVELVTIIEDANNSSCPKYNDDIEYEFIFIELDNCSATPKLINP